MFKNVVVSETEAIFTVIVTLENKTTHWSKKFIHSVNELIFHFMFSHEKTDMYC